MSKGVNLPELLVTTLFNSITSSCSAMTMPEAPRPNVSDRRSKENRNKKTSETSISRTRRNVEKRSQKKQ